MESDGQTPVLGTYTHCQRYATPEANREYLNREPTKLHWVFCNQQPYILGIGIWILFGYHTSRWSSGTQPCRQRQKPGICNETSHHVTSAGFKFRSASTWQQPERSVSHVGVSITSASVTLSCLMLVWRIWVWFWMCLWCQGRWRTW